MKKVLIITYYWPPQGGVGVQRWLKLSKYLLKHNCEPIIYTQSKGLSSLEDPSLLSSIPVGLKILRNQIFEPNKFFSFFSNKRPSSDILIQDSTNFFTKILIWLRANLFIPDSRCLFIKPSILFLNNYLQKNHVDLIISTGPPHSMHLIALALKNQHNIKWIADFRDPWTYIEYFEKLPLLNTQKKKHKNLEKEVLSQADLVLSVSDSWAKDFNQLGAKKTAVLTNGFDAEDYKYTNLNQNKSFIIGHFGLYNQLRDHVFLWDVIKKISHDIPSFKQDLKIIFSGEVHANFFKQIHHFGLTNKLDYFSYLPHSDAIRKMLESDILLVTQGDTRSVSGRLPAKLFEYIGARRPILAIGAKNSDLEKIMSNISYCWFVEFNNDKLLYDTIIKIYEMRNSSNTYNDNISQFSREEQAKDLIKTIDDLCLK